MIAVSEILRDRIDYEELTAAGLKGNFDELMYKICIIRYLYGKPMIINSGYRSVQQNRDAGGATKSNHLTCQAVDVKDLTGDFWQWCMANLELFVKLGLYFEDRSSTPRWVHIQTVPPASGDRIFKP